jgi:hypothetical protein
VTTDAHTTKDEWALVESIRCDSDAWISFMESLDKRTSERGFSFLEPLDDRAGEAQPTEAREGLIGSGA